MTIEQENRVKEIAQMIVNNNPTGVNVDLSLFGIDDDEMFKYVKDYINDYKHLKTDYPTFKQYLEQCHLWEDDNNMFAYDEELDDFITAELDYMTDTNKSISSEDRELIEEYCSIHDMGFIELCTDMGLNINLDYDKLFGYHNVSLMLGTPEEQNKDMGSISDMFGDNRKVMLSQTSQIFDNALSFFMYQQGYNASDILKYKSDYTPDISSEWFDKFLDDINYAISENTYSMAELDCFIELTPDNLDIIDKIASNEGCLEINKKNAYLCICNQWEGVGGTELIRPVQDVIIPCKFVREALVEKGGSNYPYTPNQSDTYYTSDIKVSDYDADKLIKEYHEKLGEDLSVIKEMITLHIDELEKEERE